MTSAILLRKRTQINYKSEDIIPRKVSKNDVKDSVKQKNNLIQSNHRDKVVTEDGRVFFPCQYCSRAFVEKARRSIHLNSCQAKTYILSVGNGNDDSPDSNKEKVIQLKENPPEGAKLESAVPNQLGLDSSKKIETKISEKPAIIRSHDKLVNNNNNDIREPKHDKVGPETNVVSQKVQMQKPNNVNLSNRTVNDNVPKKSPVTKNLVQQTLKVFSKQTVMKNVENKDSVVYEKLLLMSPDSKPEISDNIIESSNDLFKENCVFKANAPLNLKSLPIAVDNQNENIQLKSKQKNVKKKQTGNTKIANKQNKLALVNAVRAVNPKLPLTQSNSHDSLAFPPIKIKRKYKKREKQIVQSEKPVKKINKANEPINMTALNMVLNQSYEEFAKSDEFKGITDIDPKKTKKRKPSEMSKVKNVKKPKLSQKRLDNYNISSSLTENTASFTVPETNGDMGLVQIAEGPPSSKSSGKNVDAVLKKSSKNLQLKPATNKKVNTTNKKVIKKMSQLSKKPKIMIKFKTKPKLNKGKKISKKKNDGSNKINQAQQNKNGPLKKVVNNNVMNPNLQNEKSSNNKEVKKNNVKKTKVNKVISSSVTTKNGANENNTSAVVTQATVKVKRKYTPRKPKEIKPKKNEQQLVSEGDKNAIQNIIKCIDQVAASSSATSIPSVAKNSRPQPATTSDDTKVSRRYKPRKTKEKGLNKIVEPDDFEDEITYPTPISAADFARSLALRPVNRIVEPKPDAISIPDDDIFVEDETDEEAIVPPSNIAVNHSKSSNDNVENLSSKQLECIEKSNTPEVPRSEKISKVEEKKSEAKPKNSSPPKISKTLKKKEVLADSVENESIPEKVVEKSKGNTQVEGATKVSPLEKKTTNKKTRNKIEVCQTSPISDGKKNLHNDFLAENINQNEVENTVDSVINSILPNLQKSSPSEGRLIQGLSSIPNNLCNLSNEMSNKILPNDTVHLPQDAVKITESIVAKNILIAQDAMGKSMNSSTISKNVMLVDVTDRNAKTFTILQNVTISQDVTEGNTKTFTVLQNVVPSSQEDPEENPKTYALLQNMVPISQNVTKKSTETSTDPYITNITQNIIQKPRKEMKDASVQTVSQEVMKSVEEQLEKIFNQSDDKFKEDEVEEEFDEEMDALVLEDDPSEPKAKEEFVCHYCQKVFDKQLDMLRHRREAHKFPKILVSKKNLEKYYDIQDRTHCPICKKPIDKKHQYRSYFIKHLKTHVDDIKYTCPKCNLKFRRQDHMKSHMKRHIELH